MFINDNSFGCIPRTDGWMPHKFWDLWNDLMPQTFGDPMPLKFCSPFEWSDATEILQPLWVIQCHRNSAAPFSDPMPQKFCSPFQWSDDKEILQPFKWPNAAEILQPLKWSDATEILQPISVIQCHRNSAASFRSLERVFSCTRNIHTP